ncbi:MAG: NADH-quinone oxidoreductase subunit J [Bacteroidales bacterium]|nr:NADH-quinone oxidoreductase subunit J [Bacteroidales bacterium]
MTVIFYIAAAVAIITTGLALTRAHAVHALLYLIISLLGVSVVFFVSGAPFIAALEVIIYAGAIMVLFLFVIMMLSVGKANIEQEKIWIKPRTWVGPGIFSLILLVLFILLVSGFSDTPINSAIIAPKQVGISLFSKYLLGVEISAVLLMAGIIGAYHIGRGRGKVKHRFMEESQ